MYRILIVDDDAIVVDGLSQLLAAHYQEELDICKAYGAEEASAIIKRTKLDIVISDIDMPWKSGLDMADDIMRYWPKCRIIFLTGYSDFNYIYSAMKKRASHFILKTENDDHLLSVIQSVLDEMDAERKKQDVLRRARSELEYLRPLLTREWLQALLEQPQAGQALIAKSGGEWAIQAGSPFLVLVGSARWKEAISWETKMKCYGNVLNVFKALLPPLLAANGFVMTDSLFVWLIQPRKEDASFRNPDGNAVWDQVADYLRGALENIQNEFLSLLDLEVSFFFHRQPLGWDTWKRELDSLRQKVQRRVSGTAHLTIADDGRLQQEDDTERWVREVHEFIASHLSDDLSLVRIAEKVHMNPSYLSRYYKQVTGRNLSESISDARLKAAKRWIVEERLKFHEIAFRLGFNSPSYFTTFFKKLTGQTPQEYREAHLKEMR
ncbi:response regulator [Paenibacillus dendritiformis]|uniref:response regulator transcription factor n=1 Tax=Paenibacillus dendritiformis TaxID=130049 RepID=UPI00143CF6F5|nr:helix-turn-helix domain-containing protein [Paenibacillus dendritiformis]NKI24730.1 response regulator [Paenibacillus dendritiformis]NRG00578.1 response regulator [Paenibacillus dendritiformis]